MTNAPILPSTSWGEYDGPALPCLTLADLPLRRQRALLWRLARDHDEQAVDAYVRRASRRPCNWTRGEHILGQMTAWRGSDDLYHVFEHRARQSRCLCADRYTDRGLRHDRSSSKYVTLTGDTADPLYLHPRLICPYAKVWTSYRSPNTTLGRLRGKLLDEFGRMCQGCGLRPSVFIDHDHITGRVRGLLCRECNTHIDRCPHLDDCPWGRYLSHPPLEHLELTYPGRKRNSAEITRAEIVGAEKIAELFPDGL